MMASPSPSPPHFVVPARATRSNGDSLLVAAVRNAADLSRVDVKLVDVASGAIVGQLLGQGAGHVAATGGLICHVQQPAGGGKAAAVRVLNPATGAVTDIPAGTTAADDGQKTTTSSAAASYVFGHVPATGEYKVLRISSSTTAGSRPDPSQQSCEILTVGGREQRWRPAPSPPVIVAGGTPIVPRHRAVVQGHVHFLTSPSRAAAQHDDIIASFDLAKEEWRPSLLHGPLPFADRHSCQSSLSLVELNGCLAFVHHDYKFGCMDMWVLADLEKGTWLRIESLHLGSILYGWRTSCGELKATVHPFLPPRQQETFAQPLMVLDDGRIAFWVKVPHGVIKVYDPKTRKCKEVVGMGKLCSIAGLYKGSPNPVTRMVSIVLNGLSSRMKDDVASD